MMKFLLKTFNGLIEAFKRFPIAVFSLASETVLIWYLIHLDTDPSNNFLKIIFILAVSIVAGISVEFIIERFDRSAKFKLIAYASTLVLVALYSLIIWPSPEIDYLVGTRTVVTVFALICAALYIPSYKKAFEFNLVALTAFKAMFTSVLYALVLFLGLIATIASIDLLLFNIDEKFYGYTAALVWLFFMINYFLSLLPDFNSEDEKAIAHRLEQTSFPKLLLILISYIAVPLVAIYSLVLVSYIGKIIITFVWPIGQLGPMVLAYSIAGIVVYVLASNLENAFAKAYQKFFPMIWIPIVVTQLISITIRLNAYGITESRYYLALFGLYSLGMAIYLSLRPVVNNQKIALIAMIVALVSIIPPVDAFTISRWSQKTRLESILTDANILVDGEIVKDENASIEVRKETTSILEYMERRNYLSDLTWLESDFDLWKDFKDTFGFDLAYSYDFPSSEFYASINFDELIPVENYSVLAHFNIYSEANYQYDPYEFVMNGKNYYIEIEKPDNLNAFISLVDENGNQLIQSQSLYDYVDIVKEDNGYNRNMMAVEDMMFDSENESYRLRIIFLNIYLYNETADYDIYVLVGEN